MDEDGQEAVVIVGAGVMGASTAYHLAKLGVRSVLVEQSGVACAASGKAAGFLAEDWCDGTAVGPLARLSFRMHAALEGELGASLGYRALSAFSVSLAHRASPGAGASRTTRASPLAWLLAGDVRETRRARALGGPDSLAQVHPRLLTRALVAAAGALAGSAVRAATVVGVRAEEGGAGVAVELRTPGGAAETLRARKVVLAMGPWSVQAREWFPGLPTVMAQKYVSVVVPAAVPPHALFTEYAGPDGQMSEPEMYPREDETYFCGPAQQEPLPGDPAAIVPHAEDANGLKLFAGAVSADVKSALTDEARVVAQACYLPLSPDGTPLIGKVPGTENVFVCTGHSCWGILNAPASGLAMAELVANGQATSLDLKPFCPSRFGD